jgi:hypothetical protein
MAVVVTVRAVITPADANDPATLTFDDPVPTGIYKAFRMRPYTNRPNAFSGATSFLTNASLLACCLERSALFNLSGIPINNSRILLLRATTSLAESKDVTIFLQYVKLARIFLNNCEVEE